MLEWLQNSPLFLPNWAWLAIALVLVVLAILIIIIAVVGKNSKRKGEKSSPAPREEEVPPVPGQTAVTEERYAAAEPYETYTYNPADPAPAADDGLEEVTVKQVVEEVVVEEVPAEETQEKKPTKPAAKKSASKPAVKKETNPAAKRVSTAKLVAAKEEKAAKAAAKPAEKKEAKPAAKTTAKKETKPAAKAAESKTVKPAAKPAPKKEEKPAVSNKNDDTDKKVYHISKRKDDGKWQIKAEGGAKAIKLFYTQQEAIDYAKAIADNQPARVVVHKMDGSFRSLNYGSRK